MDVITKYHVSLWELESYDEEEKLADIYIAEKVIPQNKRVEPIELIDYES